jgi:hypothetical protein
VAFCWWRIVGEMPRDGFPKKQRLKNKGGENLAAFTSRGGVLLEKTLFPNQPKLNDNHSAGDSRGFAASATQRM